MSSTIEDLAAAVRGVVKDDADWRDTAERVADRLERSLPTPGVLTPEQRAGDPDRYRSHLLHVEPDVGRIGSSVRRCYDLPVLVA